MMRGLLQSRIRVPWATIQPATRPVHVVEDDELSGVGEKIAIGRQREESSLASTELGVVVINVLLEACHPAGIISRLDFLH